MTKLGREISIAVEKRRRREKALDFIVDLTIMATIALLIATVVVMVL